MPPRSPSRTRKKQAASSGVTSASKGDAAGAGADRPTAAAKADHGPPAGAAAAAKPMPANPPAPSCLPGGPWPGPLLAPPSDAANHAADAYYTSARFRAVEWAKWCAGAALLCVAGPYVALQIVMCNVWDQLDQRTVGLVPFLQRLSARLAPHARFVVKHKDDGFIFHLLVWLAFVLPAWFFYELYLAATVGLSLRRVLFYNIIRIGPMYMNFMFVYVMCHKEGHNAGNLFAKRFNGHAPLGLKYIFNHWAGMFHGVLPGTFTYSHLYNHHKYDNDERDVYSTAFRTRDTFASWVTYLPEWFAYASNVSSLRAFVQEGKWKYARGTLLSTLFYCAFVAACAYVHPTFTLLTLVYAFVEGNILLSIVNFVWHGFIDPDDPSNDYVNSTTVVEGLNFTLGEEYHVVHHQYAGTHWTRHPELYLKHMEGYKQCVPTAFYKQNIGFIFGYMITQDYAKLAEVYYPPFWPEGMTNLELQALLKKRLQCHGPELARNVGRTHANKSLSNANGMEAKKTN